MGCALLLSVPVPLEVYGSAILLWAGGWALTKLTLLSFFVGVWLFRVTAASVLTAILRRACVATPASHWAHHCCWEKLTPATWESGAWQMGDSDADATCAPSLTPTWELGRVSTSPHLRGFLPSVTLKAQDLYNTATSMPPPAVLCLCRSLRSYASVTFR